MHMCNKLKVYLAGPDVFYPQAQERLSDKRIQLEKSNLIAFTPLDNQVDFNNKPKDKIAFEIAHNNEAIMQSSNVILANLENWHQSPSADVGTAFEIGFMSARYERNPNQVLIIGYYPNGIPDTFSKRVMEKIGVSENPSNGDSVFDAMGYMVENFDLEDNLMLINAIHKSGGQIYASYSEAVSNIDTLWQQKQEKLAGGKIQNNHPPSISGFAPAHILCGGLFTGAITTIILFCLLKRFFVKKNISA